MHDITSDALQLRVAEWLTGQGTPVVFGLMGIGNLELIAHLDERGVKYVSARHENGVIAAADAFARVSNRVGVATVSRGAGVSNGVTALVESRKSATPLVLFVGQTATDTGDTQFLDQESVVTAAGIRYVRLHAEDVERSLSQIFAHAFSARCPVVVELSVTDQGPKFPEPSGVPVADEQGIVAAAALLATAQRPAILAGRGAVVTDAGPALERLARRTGAMLTTTAMANGMFTGNPRDLGVCGGFASPEAAARLRSADLLLVFGASLNKWTLRHGGLFAAETPVIRCDIDPAGLTRSDAASAAGSNPAASAVRLTIAGDAAEVAERLLKASSPHTAETAPRDASTAPVPTGATVDDSAAMDPEELCRALAHRLPVARTVSVDSGHFFGYAVRHIRPDTARSNVFSQAFLSMGLSIASGIGAAVARPEAVAVVVAGDGGAAMSIGELDTATRLKLKMVICVMNDAAYGMEVHELSRSGFNPALAQFADVDFAAVARGFGAEGATIRTVADLRVVDEWSQRPDRPLVLDCKIDPTKLADWYVERTAARAAEVPA